MKHWQWMVAAGMAQIALACAFASDPFLRTVGVLTFGVLALAWGVVAYLDGRR